VSEHIKTTGAICPICEHGQLIAIRPELWHCSRSWCDSEFFYDGEPGQRTLNVRSKPKRISYVRKRSPHVWPLRFLIIMLGVCLMALDGRNGGDPGIGFGIALVLFLGTAFVGRND